MIQSPLEVETEVTNVYIVCPPPSLLGFLLSGARYLVEVRCLALCESERTPKYTRVAIPWKAGASRFAMFYGGDWKSPIQVKKNQAGNEPLGAFPDPNPKTPHFRVPPPLILEVKKFVFARICGILANSSRLEGEGSSRLPRLLNRLCAGTGNIGTRFPVDFG